MLNAQVATHDAAKVARALLTGRDFEARTLISEYALKLAADIKYPATSRLHLTGVSIDESLMRMFELARDIPK